MRLCQFWSGISELNHCSFAFFHAEGFLSSVDCSLRPGAVGVASGSVSLREEGMVSVSVNLSEGGMDSVSQFE